MNGPSIRFSVPVTSGWVTKCWAETGSGAQCGRSVPADPDHPGLCDDCLARLRKEPRPCLTARIRQALT